MRQRGVYTALRKTGGETVVVRYRFAFSNSGRYCP